MEENQKASNISIVEKTGAMYIKVKGKIQKEDLSGLEESISAIEKTSDGSYFIFDFSLLEDVTLPAIRTIVLMQVEARKKGPVYVLSPNMQLKEKLVNAGAVRSGELYSNKEKLVSALKK